jgi:hypothetical protein
MAAKKRNRKGQFLRGCPGGPGRPRRQPDEEPARPAAPATRQPRRPDRARLRAAMRRADAVIGELEALLSEYADE